MSTLGESRGNYMNVPKLSWQAVILLALFLAMGDSVLAEATSKEEGTTTTKNKDLKTSDLPKPLQEIGEVIGRVGNEVSKGVSKASKAIREAPDKTDKTQTKEK
jgi:hypothetical protein